MSKSLKKLIDINRLREFKNKLVEMGSAYVQTGAVDQTVAGTKTFNSPINSPVTTGHWIDGNRGVAIINSTANAGYNVLFRMKSSHGVFTGCAYDQSYQINYTTDSIVNAGTNATTYTNTLIDENGNATFSNNITVRGTINGNLNGNVTGNAATATTATTAEACTGNAATATKAVSADSATNASHATSADKATKAEQDGNGNNIVDSYVAAGSDGSTTDIGAFMSARPSFIKSFVYNNVWTDAISMRHRNGGADGVNYGTYIRSSDMLGVSNLLWNHQCGGWQGERTIIDSANLAGFVKSNWYAAYPDGAEAHNAMWGGRDITAAFDDGTVSANIANGTFRDIFPGDYITKQVTISGTAYTVNWVIADCDYWINKGDTAMTAHHVAIVPQTPIFLAPMNATNTTEGGYAGSEMFKKIIPACATGIVNAFGSDHILEFRDGITNHIDASCVSSGIPQWTGTPGWWGMWGEWVSVQCNLMSEKMVYGAPICAAGAMDNTMATRQMSAFRLSERLINYNRQWWWLRDVVSSANFANVYGYGNADTNNASGVFGVRPFALLR